MHIIEWKMRKLSDRNAAKVREVHADVMHINTDSAKYYCY